MLKQRAPGQPVYRNESISDCEPIGGNCSLLSDDISPVSGCNNGSRVTTYGVSSLDKSISNGTPTVSPRIATNMVAVGPKLPSSIEEVYSIWFARNEDAG